MPFKDGDDVKRYVAGIFEDAFADPKTAAQLKDSGIVMRVCATDPDADFVVDTTTLSVRSVGDGGLAPNSTITMAADMHNAYWQGRLNLILAIAKKQVKIEGDLKAMLKLAPLSRPLEIAYRNRLDADGRTDLLV
jgi:hypothetical protein